MVAQSINEVLDHLERIISYEKQRDSPLAYFAILYHGVTKRIQLGISQNEFEDNARMERLDVLFANRYLHAYATHRRKEKPTASWAIPFEAKNVMVMQHLLLGINAHINLDLGIAAAETMRYEYGLAPLENDFDKINAILGSMVADVKDKIGKVSPLFKWIEIIGKGKEDKLITFSINIARDGAWLFANEYFNAVNKDNCIDTRDQGIAALAVKLIKPKSKLLQVVVAIVRFFEFKSAQQVAEILQEQTTP